MFVAAKDWVTAVTYVRIASSTYDTVLLSIALAAGVVFVFCGPLMMVLSAITLLLINTTVMGVIFVLDWCDFSQFKAYSVLTEILHSRARNSVMEAAHRVPHCPIF
jgi:hypothetical protein